MYHKLVEKTMTEPTLDNLLQRLDADGYRCIEISRGSMTDSDIEDAWKEYQESGPAGTVDFLETMFGALFES